MEALYYNNIIIISVSSHYEADVRLMMLAHCDNCVHAHLTYSLAHCRCSMASTRLAFGIISLEKKRKSVFIVLNNWLQCYTFLPILIGPQAT